MNKSRVVKLVVIVIVFALWRLIASHMDSSLSSEPLTSVHLTGTTMGPIPYSIKYLHKKGTNFQVSIDSLLNTYNNSLSTYIPHSEISRFNKNDIISFETPFFYPVLKASQQVYENTQGAFDPTIGPLVNAWGFGPDKKVRMDSSEVDSIRAIVGFDKVIFNEKEATKIAGMKLDFSAIAKGNGIDVVADFLEKKGITNYMVEIGGEVVCKGKSPSDAAWVIGIQRPSMQAGNSELLAKVYMHDKAIATSGNYRNYYVENGRIISHTISPFTGYPVTHNLLSASIFAENCTLADGYATACMVMGLEASKKLIEATREIEGVLIYSDENGDYQTYISEGMQEYVELID